MLVKGFPQLKGCPQVMCDSIKTYNIHSIAGATVARDADKNPLDCPQVLAAAACGWPDCQLMADAGLHINGLHTARLPTATPTAGATTHHFCLSG